MTIFFIFSIAPSLLRNSQRFRDYIETNWGLVVLKIRVTYLASSNSDFVFDSIQERPAISSTDEESRMDEDHLDFKTLAEMQTKRRASLG